VDVRDERCLNARNLEETLESEAAPQEVEETTWKKMNRSACGVIRSCLTQDIKYLVMNEVSAKALWDTLGNKYLTKTAESRLHLKRRLYAFRMRRGASIGEHLNSFTKLLADLLNVEVKVEDEDKAMILMNSLPEEYEVWCDSYISGKASVNYEEVSAALISRDHRKKDRSFSTEDSTSDVLAARGRSESRSKFGNRGKSRSKSRGHYRAAKDECAFCSEKGHWKKDCKKLKQKINDQKTKPQKPSEASIAQTKEIADSDFSLAISTEDSTSDVSTVRGRSEQQQFGNMDKARSKSRSTHVDRLRLSRDECAYCHKKGHWKVDCPKIKKAKDVVSSAQDDDDCDFSLMSTTFIDHSDEWIMDSACDFHMTPDINCFTSLDTSVGGTVYMGNRSACKVGGSGTVKLKMSDGSLRELVDVRYVPKLQKNLISVGALEASGMRVTIADGVLKVCKGALVMMKATRRRNMYFLQGGVVLGRVAPMFDAKGKGKADTASNRHSVRKNTKKIWVKKGSLEEDLKNHSGFGERSVLGKMRVKFATPVHQIFDVVEGSHMTGDGSSEKDL